MRLGARGHILIQSFFFLTSAFVIERMKLNAEWHSVPEYSDWVVWGERVSVFFPVFAITCWSFGWKIRREFYSVPYFVVLPLTIVAAGLLMHLMPVKAGYELPIPSFP